MGKPGDTEAMKLPTAFVFSAALSVSPGLSSLSCYYTHFVGEETEA